jgi:catechol 2,3-dioxygenase-like lactoylglutathione lyase family enzyme
MPTPIIKVVDIAYGRLRSPDLDQAETFLTAFGMVRAARTPTALYMRGTDPEHHIHITELGEPRFVGLAFKAASAGDLARIAAIPGASPVEAIDEPGGGRRVRLQDPHGYQIEIVHGIAPLAALPARRNVVNTGADRMRRKGELTRLPAGPSQVKRIGHAVIMTPNLRSSIEWYRRHFGFVCSDEVYVGDESHVIASFNRCDRGAEYVDHHVFLCVQGDHAGLNHISFEVQDIDDVMMGHEHLARTGRYKPVWGIGRHVLGSQVFDYWADPWGRVHEHWTDTDLLNAASAPQLHSAAEGLGSQWGDPVPPEFIGHASP